MEEVSEVQGDKMITVPGSYRIDEQDYHADIVCDTPSLSRSTIQALVMECPLVAWHQHPRLNPNYVTEEKAIFDTGHAAHSLLLEGIDKMAVIDAKDWKTNAAKDARDEARANGKIPVLSKQAGEIREMVSVAEDYLAHCELNIEALADEGDSELSFYWKELGCWARIRVDWIAKDRALILDYKTTGTTADVSQYQGIITHTGLDVQDALYRRGVHAVEGTQPRMVFLVQETKPPYICSLMAMDCMFREMGMQKVEKGIAMWKDCLTTNRWPGYSMDIQVVEPKPWSLAEWEMRQNPSMAI